MTKFHVAFVALFLSGAAMAQSSDPQPQTGVTENPESSAAQAEEKNERLICRRTGPAATGSQMGHRRCLTAAQWRALNRR